MSKLIDKISPFVQKNFVLLLAIAIVVMVIIVVLIIVLAKSAKKKEIENLEKEEIQQEETGKVEPVLEKEIEEKREEPEKKEEPVENEQPKKEQVEEKQEPVIKQEKKVEEKPVKAEKKEEEKPVKAEKKEEEKSAEKVKKEKPETVKEEVKVEEKKEEPNVETNEKEEEVMKQEQKGEEVKTEEPVQKVKYAGKWLIEKRAEKEFFAILKASNGEIVLTSESYVAAKSAIAGIETMKKNIALNNFQIYLDKKGLFFYKLKDSANKLLCIGEVYKTRNACEHVIESVKKFAETAILQDEVIEENQLIYYIPEDEVEEDLTTIKDAYRGKWLISTDDDNRYMAQLIASNGEVLLCTEKYASQSSLEASIDNLKENIKNNNFIIDTDKTGKFYYKLRNNQRLTLCVGETYDKQASCISAIESVKKFARRAIIKFEEVNNDGE